MGIRLRGGAGRRADEIVPGDGPKGGRRGILCGREQQRSQDIGLVGASNLI